MTAIWADLHRWLFYIALSVHPENLYDALIVTHILRKTFFNRLFQTGSDFDLKNRRFCIMMNYKESMYWLYRFQKAMVFSL